MTWASKLALSKDNCPKDGTVKPSAKTKDTKQINFLHIIILLQIQKLKKQFSPFSMDISLRFFSRFGIY
jgi:hypothetical protein